MNIKLIKTYKAEFDHWLNDGSVIWQSNGGKEWREVRDINCFKNSSVQIKDVKHIVINDEYVEFRKALCDGKTIQFKDLTEAWHDLKNPKFKDEPRHYRIKPEESQFKVGDFVRINSPSGQQFISIISYINKDNTVTLNKESVAYISDCIKWKPKHGELVWVTDYKSKNIARLGRYNAYTSTRELATEGYRLQEYGQVVFEYCEPFLNSKPSWFKE